MDDNYWKQLQSFVDAKKGCRAFCVYINTGDNDMIKSGPMPLENERLFEGMVELIQTFEERGGITIWAGSPVNEVVFVPASSIRSISISLY